MNNKHNTNKSNFLGLLYRQKNLRRWQLNYTSQDENLLEHASSTAYIAHLLALIAKKNGKQVDINRVVIAALYHDIEEVITGDIPTPTKYQSKEMIDAYESIAKNAQAKIEDMIPEEYKEEVCSFFEYNLKGEEYSLMKAADKLAAYIKASMEVSRGNYDFSSAKEKCESIVRNLNMPEVNEFLDVYMGALTKNLDDLIER